MQDSKTSMFKMSIPGSLKPAVKSGTYSPRREDCMIDPQGQVSRAVVIRTINRSAFQASESPHSIRYLMPQVFPDPKTKVPQAEAATHPTSSTAFSLSSLSLLASSAFLFQKVQLLPDPIPIGVPVPVGAGTSALSTRNQPCQPAVTATCVAAAVAVAELLAVAA